MSESAIAELFNAHERFLWGLCYRMTGNAADADDLVQETFVRAIHKPPARADEDWRPWLVQVAMNLCRDLLRYRRRRGYEGPWLPSPIETGQETSVVYSEPLISEDDDPAIRYDLLESVSFAFLLALEALTPTQRAVLLLRDVFDYSVSETANALGITGTNVKTTHHRARKAMRDYESTRRPITHSLQEKTRQVMERFLTCLSTHDVAGAEALLAKDVRELSDGGGEFIAARVPIVGREKVALFNLKLSHLLTPQTRFAWRTVNGLPALIMEIPDVKNRWASRSVMQCELDDEGLIKRIYVVVATKKLTAIAAL